MYVIDGTSAPDLNEWVRVYSDFSGSIGAPFGAGGGADPGEVASWRILFLPTLITQRIQLCNIFLIDKKKGPAWVNLTGHSIEQDSAWPARLPTYRVRLQMAEVVA